MTDLRKLSEAAEKAAAPVNAALATNTTDALSIETLTACDEAVDAFNTALRQAFRSGSLIRRSEYERLLALLAEAREALKEAREELEEYEADATGEGYNRPSLNATLSRIDDALAAEQEAKS